MTTTEITVTGMTCQHCVGAVEHEVSQIPGVNDVHVDLDTKTVQVTSTAPIDRVLIAAAVSEAGYELVGPVSD